jgi:deoxyribodipyrimidine photolyase-like uncharacterized protein
VEVRHEADHLNHHFLKVPAFLGAMRKRHSVLPDAGGKPDGGHIATKPHICSARFIQQMSDCCGDCACDRCRDTVDTL